MHRLFVAFACLAAGARASTVDVGAELKEVDVGAELKEFAGPDSDAQYHFTCIIGVDSGPPDSAAHSRKLKSLAAVNKHMASENARRVEYQFITKGDAAWDSVFNDGADLPAPRVKLSDKLRARFMMPDWEMRVSDLAGELDRLVPEFYAWATMSENVTVASDGVFDLNGLNIERAVETHPHQLVVNFYAPWCKWSQSMLPRFAEANAHVAALVAEGLLPHGTAMGKVDVDVSTDLRHAHGVNTYPTLKVFDGDSITTKPFTGFSDTAGEILSHVVARAARGLVVGSAEEAGNVNALSARVADVSAAAVTLVVCVHAAGDAAAVQAAAALGDSAGGNANLFVSSTDPAAAAAMLSAAAARNGGTWSGTAATDTVYAVDVSGTVSSTALAGADAEGLALWARRHIAPLVSPFSSEATQRDFLTSVDRPLLFLLTDPWAGGGKALETALEAAVATRRESVTALTAAYDNERVGFLYSNVNGGKLVAPAFVVISLDGSVKEAGLLGKDAEGADADGLGAWLDTVLTPKK